MPLHAPKSVDLEHMNEATENLVQTYLKACKQEREHV